MIVVTTSSDVGFQIVGVVKSTKKFYSYSWSRQNRSLGFGDRDNLYHLISGLSSHRLECSIVSFKSYFSCSYGLCITLASPRKVKHGQDHYVGTIYLSSSWQSRLYLYSNVYHCLSTLLKYDKYPLTFPISVPNIVNKTNNLIVKKDVPSVTYAFPF